MNILKKIEVKTYQNETLINNIDLNPVVSYQIIKEIVNRKINDIMEYLNTLTVILDYQ